MPIYDLRCGDCGNRFEALVLGGRQPCCPGCGGKNLERLPSAFAFRSSGGGSSAGSGCSGCSGGDCSRCR